MPRGGYRGGIRPPVWQKVNGEKPDLKTWEVPRHLHPELKAIAFLLDQGLVTLAQIQAIADGKKEH